MTCTREPWKKDFKMPSKLTSKLATKDLQFKFKVAGFTVFFTHPLWASNPLGGRDTRSRWKGACVRQHATHGIPWSENLSITWGTNPAPTKLGALHKEWSFGVSTQIKSCNFQSYTLTFMATPSAFEPRPTASSRGFSRDGKRGANHARAWVFFMNLLKWNGCLPWNAMRLPHVESLLVLDVATVYLGPFTRPAPGKWSRRWIPGTSLGLPPTRSEGSLIAAKYTWKTSTYQQVVGKKTKKNIEEALDREIK